MLVIGVLATVALGAAASSQAPRPRRDYRLDLVAAPPFRFISRLGAVRISVFPKGVRAASPVFHAFTRNGEDFATVMSPITRLYGDVALDQLGPALLGFRRDREKLAAPGEYPLDESRLHGTFAGLHATRYRILLGPKSHLDVWTTEDVETNPQYRRVVAEMVGTFARDLAAPVSQLPGSPIHVVLKSRRFDNAVLLRLTKVWPTAHGHEESLKVGRFYVKAPFAKVLRK